MPRTRVKESEKAATSLSDIVIGSNAMIGELSQIANRFQDILVRDHGENYRSAGLCAIRDTCNVLIWQAAEADLEAGSAMREELEEKIRAQIELQKF